MEQKNIKQLTQPNTSIIDAIQIAVNETVRKKYPKQDGLYYFVSPLTEGERNKNNNQKIVITIVHGTRSFSEVLFPEYDSYYGYEWLEDKIERLFNRTM